MCYVDFLIWFLVATEKSVAEGAEAVELDVYDFKGPGVALSMYNVDEVFWNINRTHCYLLLSAIVMSSLLFSLLGLLLSPLWLWHFPKSGLFISAPRTQS
jgi:hypothetical protein